jgi:hypothetical protein
MAEMKRR